MKEIEIKLKVENVDEIREKILSLGAVFVKKEGELDEYFDFEDEKLKKEGKAFRIRNKKTVCFKESLESSEKKVREETEVNIDDYDGFVKFLDLSKLKKDFVKEKVRETFKKNNLEITIDTLPHIGIFLELEGPEKEIDEIAAKLGFSKKDYIKETYMDLFDRFKKEHSLEEKDMVFENDDKK